VRAPPSAARRVAGLAGAVLVAAGCLTAHDVLVGPTWKLTHVRGASPAAAASLSFAGDGTFTVETGCNTVGGTYHLDGNRILLDTVQQTPRQCDGEVAAQEAGILAVLGDTPAYAIDSGTGRLRLTSEAAQVLLFEP